MRFLALQKQELKFLAVAKKFNSQETDILTFLRM